MNFSLESATSIMFYLSSDIYLFIYICCGVCWQIRESAAILRQNNLIMIKGDSSEVVLLPWEIRWAIRRGSHPDRVVEEPNDAKDCDKKKHPENCSEI